MWDSMQGKSSSPGQWPCRRGKVRPGGVLVRLLWLCGYLSVTFAALLSTYAFPEILSVFRSSQIPYQSYKFPKQSDIQVQSRSTALSWTKEFVPSIRWKKPNIATEHRDAYIKLWKAPPNQEYAPCVTPSKHYYNPELMPFNGYLVVQSNGGLNQMRAGICDMVAVARILNVTLVIPELDKRSFWQDSSNFSDVFDEDYFIKALEGDVPIVRKLPDELLSEPKATKQFRSWSNSKYYEEEIAPLLKDFKVIRAVKSDSRLANNDLRADIQKLRCRVHYDALRFAPRIEELGQTLVERMRSNGPFIALHLRYEKDMLAFSGCTYGLSKEQADELTSIREQTVHWKVKNIDATEQRSKGACPLTPKEVGVFLRSLGYSRSTQIYVAAGELYGGTSSMDDLRSYFPNVMTKETIASPEELEPFGEHATQMAALDYIVSVESDVFVPSYSGNMARAVEGHRRYFGHRKTIIPDRKELVVLFDKLDGELVESPELSRAITRLHRGRQGAPRKRKGPLKGTKGRERFRTEEAFYTNPLPDCLCRKSETFTVLSGMEKSSNAQGPETLVQRVQQW